MDKNLIFIIFNEVLIDAKKYLKLKEMSEAIASVQTEKAQFNPFPGLRSYNEKDAQFFFGRESHIKELKLKLANEPFIAIVGGSDSGKSSLVHAGLIPTLKKDGFELTGRKDWMITHFIPREKPIEDLAFALAVLKDKPSLIEKDSIKKKLLDTIDVSGTQGIAQVYKELKLDQSKNLLIVIDQFEDLFRYYDYKVGMNQLDFINEAQKFVNLLLAAANQDRYPIFILITIRSGAMARTGIFPGLSDAMNNGQYSLPPMTENEVKQAIAGPIIEASKHPEFRDAVKGGKKDNSAHKLAEKIWSDLIKKDKTPLPVIQLMLKKEWTDWVKRDRTDAFDFHSSSKDVKEVISTHANNVFNQLNDDEKIICERLFKALIRRSDPDKQTFHHDLEFAELNELVLGPRENPNYIIYDVIEKYKENLRRIHEMGEGDIALNRELISKTGAKFLFNNDEEQEQEQKEENYHSKKEYYWLSDEMGGVVAEEEEEFKKSDLGHPSLINDEVFEKIINLFRHPDVSFVSTFGENPKTEEPAVTEVSTDIIQQPLLENAFVVFSNQIILDEMWGWDILLDWKDEEEQAASAYRQIFHATHQWRNSEKEVGLMRNPELGNGIRWLYKFQPNWRWAQTYDNEFNASHATEKGNRKTAFPDVIEFLHKSFAGYAKEKIQAKEKMKADLRKAKRNSRIFFALGILSFLFAGYAIYERGVAKEKEQIAYEQKQEAEDSKNRASALEKKANIAREDALDKERKARIAEAKALKSDSIANKNLGIAEREKRRAEKLQKEAEEQEKIAQLAAARSKLLAMQAEIEAYFANRLKDIAEESKKTAEERQKDAEFLQKMEEIRKQSLLADRFVKAGQLKDAEKELLRVRENLEDLKEDRPKEANQPISEVFQALQSYFFAEEKKYIHNNARNITAIIKPKADEKRFVFANGAGAIQSFTIESYKENNIKKDSIKLDPKPIQVFYGLHIRCLAVSEDGQRLAVGTSEGEIIMLDLTSGSKNKELDRYSFGDSTVVRKVFFLPENSNDSYRLLTYHYHAMNTDRNKIQYFTFDDKKFGDPSTNPIKLGAVQIDRMAYDKKSRKIFLAGRDKNIYVYNENGRQQDIINLERLDNVTLEEENEVLSSRITAIESFSGNGYEWLAVGTYNGNVHLIDVETKKPVFKTLTKQNSSITSPISGFDLVFNANKVTYFLGVSSFDHSVSIVNVFDRIYNDQVEYNSSPVIINELDKFMKKRGEDKVGEPKYEEILRIFIHTAWVHDIVFVDELGQKALTISEDKTIKLWYTERGLIDNVLFNFK